MPKPAYRIILGVFLLSFVVTSCGNKTSSKETETKKDTILVKPVDPGNEPVDPGNNPNAPDTIKKKPVDPGN